MINRQSILRYVRIFFDAFALWGYLYLGQQDLRHPSTSSSDVTLISSTLGEEPRYEQSLRSWIASGVTDIIVVTIDDSIEHVQKILAKIQDCRFRLLSVPKADYRAQMSLGIRNVERSTIVFADDRIYWRVDTLSSMLAALEDPNVGGVNTMGTIISTNGSPHELTIWESFGALNMVRRNILHSFVAYVNQGQVLNLSGRTVAYRTKILQNENFFTSYKNDYWRGKILLKTGDDNFLTNWTLHHGWRTAYVNNVTAMTESSVCPDRRYLKQITRWSRDTARSYLRDLGFAVRQKKGRHLFRAVLNIISNYIVDLIVLYEVIFLIAVTVAAQIPQLTSESVKT